MEYQPKAGRSVGVIGYGAIASYISKAADRNGFRVTAALARPGREDVASAAFPDAQIATRASDLPGDLACVLDCAGHAGLRTHGPAVLAAGTPLITVSSGALADPTLQTELEAAARQGGTQLRIASGAIGALDALASAACGQLRKVTYIGRKPPIGWRGSPAEEVADLDRLEGPLTHFEGSARDCARAYPKNANVAASVALAGLGLDETSARLIADPSIDRNLHEVTAEGDFGAFTFTIAGRGLPDNPRSSALTAMSLVRAVRDRSAALVVG